MEPKYNNATHNRPEGDRVLDASYVLADLYKYSEQLKEEKAGEKNDRNGITIFKSGKQTIVLSLFKKGAEAAGNAVKGTTTIQVMEGSISLIMDTSTAEMNEPSLAVVHEEKLYSIRAKEECLLLITTHLS